MYKFGKPHIRFLALLYLFGRYNKSIYLNSQLTFFIGFQSNTDLPVAQLR